MLLSSDIWALVEQEPSAFRAVQLHNTTFVINAFDFMHNAFQRGDLDTTFGGDYCLVAEIFKQEICNYLRCNNEPIFVFGGASPCTTPRFLSQICHLQKQIRNLDRVLREKDRKTGFSYFPVFAKEVLVSVLTDLGVSHVTCNTDTVVACVALAAYLRCPLIADSGDLLLYEFEDPVADSARFVYMPLRFFSAELLPLLHDPQTFCLSSHAFCPSGSSLHRIQHNLRPFFALYLQPPSGVIFPLSPRASEIKRSRPFLNNASPVQLAHDRVMTFIQWLEDTKSPFEALDDSVGHLNDQAAIASFIRQLVTYTLALKIDFSQAADLANFVFPDILPREQEICTSVDLITWLKNQKNVPKRLQTCINLIETEAIVSGCEIEELFTHASPVFLCAYRSGSISPVMLSRLFSRSWVLNVLMEDLAADPVTDSSRGLRYLQYCLTLGFIRQCGIESPNCKDGYARVSETTRSKEDPTRIVEHTLHLKPFTLPLDTENHRRVCTSFIFENLGYEIKTDDNWMQALSLALCYRHVNATGCSDFYLLKSPISFALCLVVCCIQCSNGAISNKHLEDLADSLPADFNIGFIHQINELQLVYMSVISLIRAINVLCACASPGAAGAGDEEVADGGAFALLPYLPGEVVFGHSRLIHNLAVAISMSTDQNDVRFWLKKICPASVPEASGLMARMVSVVAKMVKVVRKVDYESHDELHGFPVPHRQLRMSSSPRADGQSFASNGNGRFQRGAPRGHFNGRFAEPPRGRGRGRSGSSFENCTNNFYGFNNHQQSQRSLPKPNSNTWDDFNRRLTQTLEHKAQVGTAAPTNPFETGYEGSLGQDGRTHELRVSNPPQIAKVNGQHSTQFNRFQNNPFYHQRDWLHVPSGTGGRHCSEFGDYPTRRATGAPASEFGAPGYEKPAGSCFYPFAEHGDAASRPEQSGPVCESQARTSRGDRDIGDSRMLSNRAANQQNVFGGDGVVGFCANTYQTRGGRYDNQGRQQRFNYRGARGTGGYARDYNQHQQDSPAANSEGDCRAPRNAPLMPLRFGGSGEGGGNSRNLKLPTSVADGDVRSGGPTRGAFNGSTRPARRGGFQSGRGRWGNEGGAGANDLWSASAITEAVSKLAISFD